MSAAAGGVTRTLLGLKGPGRKREIVIWDTDQITIGRSPESDIVVDEEDVSRDHAVLIRGHADFFVQDLETANGTDINGGRLMSRHTLQTKDVVQVGPLEITFIRTKKEPASLGLDVVYSSQLKGVAGGAASPVNPEATMLALGGAFGDGAAAEFKVGEVADFGYDVNSRSEPVPAPGDPEPAPAVRNLDLDIGDMFIQGGPEQPAAPAPAAARQAAAPQAAAPPLVSNAAATGSLSLTLELTGLTPELRGLLSGLQGKLIELPALRIHIKGDDLI